MTPRIIATGGIACVAVIAATGIACGRDGALGALLALCMTMLGGVVGFTWRQ